MKELESWKYKKNEDDLNSFLVIHKLEDNYVAHISVYNILVEGEEMDIGHIPIKIDVLRESLIEPTGYNYEEDSTFIEGYENWKDEEGGVWDIPIKEVITQIKNTITNNTMSKFEIKTDKSGQFRFNLKAGNGQTILASEAYTTKAACNNGIESVKTNSQDDNKYDRLTAKDGSPYFNLKASNGQIIGTSEMYSSKDAMENGIASVKKNAPNATVEDNS